MNEIKRVINQHWAKFHKIWKYGYDPAKIPGNSKLYSRAQAAIFHRDAAENLQRIFEVQP